MQNIIQSNKYRSIKVQHLPILEKTSNFAIVRTTIMLNQRQTIGILTAGNSDTALLTYVNQCSQYLTAYKIVSASVTAGLILITQINEIDVYFIAWSWSFKTCLLLRQVLTTPQLKTCFTNINQAPKNVDSQPLEALGCNVMSIDFPLSWQIGMQYSCRTSGWPPLGKLLHN